MVAIFHKDYTHEEAMEDAKWLLLFFSVLLFQAGLFQGFVSFLKAGLFMGIAVAVMLIAFTPHFWLRTILIFVWTIIMTVDFFIRYNPFSVFFIIVGLYHLALMLKSRNVHVEDVA